jgi:hypothetical protein
VSPSPSLTAPASKQTIVVPQGSITITCYGDTVVGATASLTDSSYRLTVKSHSDPAVDVEYTKGTSVAEYVYKCRAGQPLGGIVEQP